MKAKQVEKWTNNLKKEKAGKKKVKQDSKTRTSNRSTGINTDNDNNSRVIKSRALFPFPVHYCHTESSIKENIKDFQCLLFLKSPSSFSDSVSASCL